MSSINVTSLITKTTISTSVLEWNWSLRTITVLTICALITILTILGNGLVLISVKVRLHARSYSDYFIVSLCLADFFVGLFVMPFMTLHSIQGGWPFHYRLCHIWMSIDFTCSTASFLTLASMALDRYWALTAPYFHLRNRSYSSVLIFIVSSWAIPFAIWPCSIFIGQHFSNKPGSCNHPASPRIILILCIFFYYIPLLFMLACYSRIIVNIKNIEIMIRGAWGTLKFDPDGQDFKPSVTLSTPTTGDGCGRTVILDNNNNNNNQHHPSNTTTTSQSTSSLRTLLLMYLRRNSPNRRPNKSPTTPVESPFIVHGMASVRHRSSEYHQAINQTRRATTPGQLLSSHTLAPGTSSTIPPSNNVRRHSRRPTTATFTGQKRCLNDSREDNRSKAELLVAQEEELVRSRLNSRTSSMPAARCISYYYHQNQTPPQTFTTTALVQDHHHHHRHTLSERAGGPMTSNGHNQHQSRTPSSLHDRSRSQSHSSGHGGGNGGMVTTTDISDHSSSFDNGVDDEHRRLNRRNQPSRPSTSYNSSRYSQRAVAQFMHERHKARLRRNQKASRMLGILLAVFLICWLPFIIAYPTMMFYENKLPSDLVSLIFWFGYINSLLNPLLYVYSSSNFRRAIFATLCCCTRLRSRPQLRYQWSLRAGHN